MAKRKLKEQPKPVKCKHPIDKLIYQGIDYLGRKFYYCKVCDQFRKPEAE